MLMQSDRPMGCVKVALYLSVIIFCLYVSACQAKADPGFLTLTSHNSIKLELYNQGGKCSIRVNGASQGRELGVPYPCGFVRVNKKSGAQTYNYEGVGQVFVVAGPPAEREAYKDSGVNYDHMCSNYGQSVIIQGEELTLRTSQNVSLGFCHLLGFDEKAFYGFAYPVE
ncbi:hypothetical protein [Microbulbifer taiwanensis]|uniref:Uncharacterized protein n=2 Tax=Microbulbifer taiwanensis TaxID=986746 RepID=A0ABW1YK74_9GAMM